MKITIQEKPDCAETEVVIVCKETNGAVLRVVSALREQDRKLTGVKDGKTYVVEPSDVLYFDTVDKRTFFYTAEMVLETPLRLYEIEEMLSATRFFRAAKSTIINIAKIQSIVPDLGGRLEVTLQNGERLMVSRQYAHELKLKLGM